MHSSIQKNFGPFNLYNYKAVAAKKGTLKLQNHRLVMQSGHIGEFAIYYRVS